MTRHRWFLLIAAVAAVIACCCLIVAGASAWVLVTASRNVSISPTGGSSEPTPEVDIVRVPPTAAERETARAVAGAPLPERELIELVHRLGGMSKKLAEQKPADAPDYSLGDELTFWVHNEETTSYFTATAELAYVTPHAYWWVQRGYDVPADDLEESAQVFEGKTYPTDRRVFGSEPNPGIDGDPHVYIFLGKVPGVGGYFSSPDEYPNQVTEYSNQHEMFYINLDNSMPGNDYFDGVLAHEFEHMIHWAVDRNEDTWVNEGLAELAVQINHYGSGGLGQAYTSNPDTQLTTWPETEDSATHYAASYLFMAYFLDRYGERAIRRLVAEPADGIAGIEAVLAEVDPTHPSFGSLFAEWSVANYLDDTRLAGGRYGYAGVQVRQPVPAAEHTTFPVNEQATVHQFASDYVVLEGRGALTVEFTGSLQIPLVGNRPHSEQYEWWSKRGDEGDATLTRSFDLTGLSHATLEAWMWYHLETNYDYAYVEASADGGQTWTLLSNGNTTILNPVGSSYGPSLTGISGEGETPAWVHERFDLTSFAGSRVTIRFEVVTDDTINYPGLCLDDLSIPELGFADDVERPDIGWQSQGWVRVTADVPQQFMVQLITIGAKTQVQRMELDPEMHGSLLIPDMGSDVKRAVLVVSAVTPDTTESASYAYRVTKP